MKLDDLLLPYFLFPISYFSVSSVIKLAFCFWDQ